VVLAWLEMGHRVRQDERDRGLLAGYPVRDRHDIHDRAASPLLHIVDGVGFEVRDPGGWLGRWMVVDVEAMLAAFVDIPALQLA